MTYFGAITLDTSIIRRASYNFDSGILSQLRQFQESPITLVMSEIVFRETRNHLIKQYQEKKDALWKALKEAGDLLEHGDDNPVEMTVQSPTVVSNRILMGFLGATGTKIVSSSECPMGDLMRRYFSSLAPFDTSKKDKKNEFPDAIALISLEAWAKQNNTKIIAVSCDSGWAEFAKESQHIFCVDSLALGLEEVQKGVDKIKSGVHLFLTNIENDINSIDASNFRSLLSAAVSSIQYDVVATSPHRYEEDGQTLTFRDFSFLKSNSEYEIRVVSAKPDECTITIALKIFAQATTDFSYYHEDCIDGDEVAIGSSSETMDIEFDLDFLISFLGDLNGPHEEVDIDDMQPSGGIVIVDHGDLEPDYHIPDDYDELDLP